MSQEALWSTLGRMQVDPEFQQRVKSGSDEALARLGLDLSPPEIQRLMEAAERYDRLVDLFAQTRNRTRQWQEGQLANIERTQKEMADFERETHASLRADVVCARAAAGVVLVAAVAFVLAAPSLLAVAAVTAWTTREPTLPVVLGGLGLGVLIVTAFMHPLRSALRTLRQVSRTETVTLALLEQGLWWGAALRVNQVPIELVSQQYHAHALNLLRAFSGDVPEPPPQPSGPAGIAPEHADVAAGRAHNGRRPGEPGPSAESAGPGAQGQPGQPPAAPAAAHNEPPAP